MASTLSTTQVSHLSTAGQKFAVGNFARAGATLWSSTQRFWDSSKGEVIQVLKKSDLYIHTCFSLEKTFLSLRLQWKCMSCRRVLLWSLKYLCIQGNVINLFFIYFEFVISNMDAYVNIYFYPNTCGFNHYHIFLTLN